MLFLSLKVANLASFSSADSYRVNAKFENIGGLKDPRTGQERRRGGWQGGRYPFRQRELEAVVSMSIDSRFQFPKDSSAKILTSGLLGEQYIGIAAGGDSVI